MSPDVLIGAAIDAADARLYAALAVVLAASALYIVMTRPRVVTLVPPPPPLVELPPAPAPAGGKS